MTLYQLKTNGKIVEDKRPLDLMFPGGYKFLPLLKKMKTRTVPEELCPHLTRVFCDSLFALSGSRIECSCPMDSCKKEIGTIRDDLGRLGIKALRQRFPLESVW